MALQSEGKIKPNKLGSMRDTQEGKGRFDLISPFALMRLALHYENGARKYAERNWEKGQLSSRCLNSAMRHLNAWLAGSRDEDHLAAAAWNIFALMHNEEAVQRDILSNEVLDIRPYNIATFEVK